MIQLHNLLEETGRNYTMNKGSSTSHSCYENISRINIALILISFSKTNFKTNFANFTNVDSASQQFLMTKCALEQLLIKN